MATPGNSGSTSAATALTKRRSEPAGPPSSSSTARHFGQVQGPKQSFWETEAIVAAGLARSRSFRFLTSSRRMSSFVRQSWAFSDVLRPSISLNHSG